MNPLSSKHYDDGTGESHQRIAGKPTRNFVIFETLGLYPMLI